MTDEEIRVARSSMQTYILFTRAQGVTPKRRAWFGGAAAAINDLLCRLGKGEAVADLAEELEEL